MTTELTDRRTSRRALVVGGLAGLTGAVALGGCTPSPTARKATGPDWTSLGDRLVIVRPESLPDLEPAAPEGPGRLETSAGRYVLAGTHLRTVLDPMLAGELRFGSDAPEEEIAAPEGEEYLFFSLESELVPWGFTRYARRPQIVVRIHRPDGQVELVENWATIAGDHMVRVIADPGPEDAVLEITDHDKVQRLSLIDGSLLDSEVRHIYGRHLLVGATPGVAAIELEDRFEAEHETEGGELDRLTLETTHAATSPMTSRLGWAEDGEQFVGVRVRTEQFYSPAFSRSRTPVPVDPSISVLRLADGTELSPVDIENAATAGDRGVFSPTEDLLWFAVPADLEVAHLALRVEPFPRRADLAELLDVDAGLITELTFEPGI